MTSPHPVERIDTALRHARDRWAATDPRDRRFVGGVMILCFGVVAAFAVASAARDVWVTAIGPLVWDTAHGDRDAFLRLGAIAAVLVVGGYVLRAVAILAAPLLRAYREDPAPTTPPEVTDTTT